VVHVGVDAAERSRPLDPRRIGAARHAQARLLEHVGEGVDALLRVEAESRDRDRAADGPVHIRNVANIRIKETDRLAATVTELRRLGQHVEHGDDWLAITPAPVTPALVHCYDDHRIAMSFAILGAATGGVTLDDPACVSKTYPGFFDDLARAYAAAGVAFAGA
jgi:hypothetical protein